MPLENIKQPEIIQVSDCLRLRKFESLSGMESLALGWYQDPDTVRLVDGPQAEAYTLEKLEKMYAYLSGRGELYWIEEDRGQGYRPVGDASLLPKGDTPVVIGAREDRGRGLGRAVVSALISRGEALGFSSMSVDIYDYNHDSKRLFRSLGYIEGEATAHGHKYVLSMYRRLYAAYGSNMNVEQMRLRCPGAKALGAGELPGMRLEFRAGGKGVYLTVEPQAGGSVPVAVWEIGPGSEIKLDEYEVYPSLYYKEPALVRFKEIETGRERQEQALVYIMCPGHRLTVPGEEYFEACAQGYRAFGLDTAPLYEAREYSASHD